MEFRRNCANHVTLGRFTPLPCVRYNNAFKHSLTKTMTNKRETDPVTRSWFRTGRFTEDCGLWYFHTRENTTEGPFSSMFDAKIQLDRYIKVITSGLLANENKYSLAHF